MEDDVQKKILELEKKIKKYNQRSWYNRYAHLIAFFGVIITFLGYLFTVLLSRTSLQNSNNNSIIALQKSDSQFRYLIHKDSINDKEAEKRFNYQLEKDSIQINDYKIQLNLAKESNHIQKLYEQTELIVNTPMFIYKNISVDNMSRKPLIQFNLDYLNVGKLSCRVTYLFFSLYNSQTDDSDASDHNVNSEIFPNAEYSQNCTFDPIKFPKYSTLFFCYFDFQNGADTSKYLHYSMTFKIIPKTLAGDSLTMVPLNEEMVNSIRKRKLISGKLLNAIFYNK